MEIESVRNKALRHFLETGRPVGLDAQLVARIRNMIAYLHAATDCSELVIPPNFGFHWLTGNRAGTAALTLTRNWRMTFKVSAQNRIIDLDLEDYH